MSYRIKVNFDNRSASTQASASQGVGATVVPAIRGKDEPVMFKRGQTTRLSELVGTDSKEALEAIAYNTKYPLWVVAPHSGGLRGGVLMTKTGLIPFNFASTSLNFAALPFRETLGIGDGTVTAFSKTIAHFAKYVNRSVDLYVDGVLVDVTASDEASEILTATGAGAGTGTLLRATGALSWEFTLAPAVGAKIEVQYSTNWAVDAYAAIGMAFPCEDFLAAAITVNEDNAKRYDLTVQTKKNGVYYDRSEYAMTFGLLAADLDDSKQPVFLERLLDDGDDLLFAKVNTALTPTTYTGVSTLTDFAGGYRGKACDAPMLVTGWEKYKKTKLYPADIYFDASGEPTVATAMAAVRAVRKYKTFLYPQPLADAEATLTGTPLTVADRGLRTFWAPALISNAYSPTGGNLVSNLMGEIAAKYADALVYSYGGRASAWADENNVGGQLGMGRVVKMLYDVDESQLQAMDKARINPVYEHPTLGVIIASRRTTDKSNSDYSYADYSAIIDYCVERIENEVLPFQLIKMNDDTHRSMVKSKAESILRPLTVSPNNVIFEYLVKCDSENNGDEVLNNEEFILTVAIKVTRKSEFITFNFVNGAQTSKIEELV